MVTKALTVSESHPLLRSHSLVTHCSENHITDVQSSECESLCSCGGLFHVRSSECDSVLLWDPRKKEKKKEIIKKKHSVLAHAHTHCYLIRTLTASSLRVSKALGHGVLLGCATLKYGIV